MGGNGAGFSRMRESTADQWAVIGESFRRDCAAAADNALALFRGLKAAGLAFRLGPYDHGLQTATRALRDGADEETVVVALLHDIGDVVCPANHAEFAAAMLRPYITAESHWMLLHHELFQTRHWFGSVGLDPTAADRHRGHPAFERTARFCEVWDQASFDPDYDTLPLETFEPMVRRLLGRAPYADPANGTPTAAAAGLVVNMAPGSMMR